MVYIGHRGRVLIDVWAKKAYGKSIAAQMWRSKGNKIAPQEKDATITDAIVTCFTKAQMSAEEIAVNLQIEPTVVKRVLKKEGLLKKK